MRERASDERDRRVLVLDADVLGLAAGLFFGGVVMALGFFLRERNVLDAVLRAGVTFVAVYAATFVAVRYVRRVLLAAMNRRREHEKE